MAKFRMEVIKEIRPFKWHGRLAKHGAKVGEKIDVHSANLAHILWRGRLATMSDKEYERMGRAYFRR